MAIGRHLSVGLLAVLLVACGGGSSAKAPNAWAAAVCGQIASWEDRVGSLATEVESSAQAAGEDLAAARAELVGLVDRIVERTDRMTTAVEDEGRPSGANGEAVAAGLREGLAKSHRALTEARTKAQSLSLAGASEFRQGAEEVVDNVAAAGETVEQELTTLGERFDNPSVGAAIDNEPDCQHVTTRGDTQPRAWADDLCGRIVSWQDELESLVGGLQAEVEGLSGDLTAARARLIEFMTQVVSSTDRLLEATEQTGAPDVPQGDDVARHLQDGLLQVRHAFEEGRANAENLAVDDPAAFTAGTQRISENIREAGDRIEQELRDLERTYDIPQLDQAFAEAPACQGVSGS